MIGRILLTLTCFTFLYDSHAQKDISVYFIGDAGAPMLPTDQNLAYFKKITLEADTSDILIFLGDNLYPEGLPDEDDPSRFVLEEKLNASLDIMKAFKGRAMMIPGNHDWANGTREGWKRVVNMQKYVDRYLGKPSFFLPSGGCPGPIELEISPEIVLVIIDTQYLLHPWEKPDNTDGCEAESSAGAVLMFKDILDRNSHRQVLVAGHHPMFSYGPHGSTYTFRQHVFPLTDVNRALWLPLPVIGSIYPLFRSMFGSKQDITNPRYMLVRNTLVEMMANVKDLVYISGHEHSLQYIKRDSIHYVVSGSGTKLSNVGKGNGTEFEAARRGFSQLIYDANGDVTLKFHDGLLQESIYEEKILTKKVEEIKPEVQNLDFQDSVIVTPITDRYANATKAREYWLGENYRNVWATPVEMPVFNIGTEKEDLKIIKLGGGNQTKSLRLEDANGKQYVLRSADKYTEKLLPAALYKTLVSEIIQDQTSSGNPYGAYAVPSMSAALGLYHTNPKLVYIPNDPRFGKYQETFANMPALFEERPNHEFATAPFFGKGEDIEGTPDVLERMREDNDEAVDQPFALRNRLFDMIIGDWDRHEDQWRWVEFDKEPSGHLWRSIPRDRDQAFFINEGVFGWFMSRKFALPNVEGFDEKMDYPPGFNASAQIL